jgi:hypothetical protein
VLQGRRKHQKTHLWYSNEHRKIVINSMSSVIIILLICSRENIAFRRLKARKVRRANGGLRQHAWSVSATPSDTPPTP